MKKYAQYGKIVFFCIVLSSGLAVITNAGFSNSENDNIRLLIPDAAINQGYTQNTFSSRFSEESVDLYNSKKSNYDWYTGKFFGWKPHDPYNITVESGQAIKITGDKSANFILATATSLNDEQKWVGKAFGGGGYFEAEIKFNHEDINPADGWPAFWMMAIEHLAFLDDEQWKGQEKEYSHFIEVDIMEYMLKEKNNPSHYIATMHDWFGVWKKTCSSQAFCKHSLSRRESIKRVSPEVDMSTYHKYGFLWVPATDENEGYGQFYFDNQPAGKKIIWTRFNAQSPSMEKQNWTFGILDHQHLALILGAGINQTMEVRSVNVWQKNSDHNLAR